MDFPNPEPRLPAFLPEGVLSQLKAFPSCGGHHEPAPVDLTAWEHRPHVPDAWRLGWGQFWKNGALPSAHCTSGVELRVSDSEGKRSEFAARIRVDDAGVVCSLVLLLLSSDGSGERRLGACATRLNHSKLRPESAPSPAWTWHSSHMMVNEGRRPSLAFEGATKAQHATPTCAVAMLRQQHLPCCGSLEG